MLQVQNEQKIVHFGLTRYALQSPPLYHQLFEQNTLLLNVHTSI